MSSSLGFTADDLAAMRAAVVRGESKVRFSDGREVTYRSVPEMITAIAFAESRQTVPFDRTTLTSFARD